MVMLAGHHGRFEPGSRTVVEWKSYTSDATDYLIEVGPD